MFLLTLPFISACGSGSGSPVNPNLIIFAQGGSGESQPDSIALTSANVWVGYGDGNLPDGSDGKSNQIVEYDFNGAVVNTFTVLGHNDGLKVNPADGTVWALQNEDSNPNLVIINPSTKKQSTFTFGPTPHGGGYDDMVFTNGQVFMSASAPANNPNTGPAIVQATLSGSQVNVSPVVLGNATALNIVTNTLTTLNLQDPDSMTLDPSTGNLVLTSQADDELVIVGNVNSPNQTVSLLPLTMNGKPVSVDDSVFVTSRVGTLLIVDQKANAIYVLKSSSFVPGTVFSSAADIGKLGMTDLTTGVFTPQFSFSQPKGLAFTSNLVGVIL
jgi:hypothetical protein